MPAEIDYAFIADYARVEPTGALTVVNASWMFLNVPQFPTMHRLSVVARIRSTNERGVVPLRVVITGPDDVYRLTAGAEVGPGAGTTTYGDDKVGLIFAVDTDVPIPRAGLYRIRVDLPEDESTRDLAFEARMPRSPSRQGP